MAATRLGSSPIRGGSTTICSIKPNCSARFRIQSSAVMAANLMLLSVAKRALPRAYCTALREVSTPTTRSYRARQRQREKPHTAIEINRRAGLAASPAPARFSALRRSWRARCPDWSEKRSRRPNRYDSPAILIATGSLESPSMAGATEISSAPAAACTSLVVRSAARAWRSTRSRSNGGVST